MAAPDCGFDLFGEQSNVVGERHQALEVAACGGNVSLSARASTPQKLQMPNAPSDPGSPSSSFR
jgi:hypothetical protein